MDEDRNEESMEKVEGFTFKNPYLRYTGIFLGVSFTAFGLLLLMWGLLWQGQDIILSERGAQAKEGGLCLIPSAIIILALGILWLNLSLKTKKAPMKKVTIICPNCGRVVDGTLPFCYWCGAPLNVQDKKEEKEKGGKPTPWS